MPERSAFVAALNIIAALPGRLIVGLIWVYQRTLSPALPVIFGSACGCRFSPTCSHYAIGAIRTHGLVVGSTLALWRLVKCTPLHPGGFDPVPTRTRFTCIDVNKANPAKS
jgi:putative membrane protein insertion efficiency factor